MMARLASSRKLEEFGRYHGSDHERLGYDTGAKQRRSNAAMASTIEMAVSLGTAHMVSIDLGEVVGRRWGGTFARRTCGGRSVHRAWKRV